MKILLKLNTTFFCYADFQGIYRRFRLPDIPTSLDILRDTQGRGNELFIFVWIVKKKMLVFIILLIYDIVDF